MRYLLGFLGKKKGATLPVAPVDVKFNCPSPGYLESRDPD